jgi:hypothetical protein
MPKQFKSPQGQVRFTMTEVTNTAPVAPVAPITNEKFFFRPRPLLDEVGNKVIDPATGKNINVPAHAPVAVQLPYINSDALINDISDEAKSAKVLAFIVDLVNGAIFTEAQGMINVAKATEETSGIEPDWQASIKNELLDLFYLASVEKVAVTRGIPKELWAAAKVDMIEVLTANFGISIAGATKAAKTCIDDKLSTIQTRHDLLNLMGGYLANWFNKTSEENKEKFAPIYGVLTDKIDMYVNVDEKSVLDQFA